MLFTCIKSWFFRHYLANFHQISQWAFCWNVIDSLFKWSCSTGCQAHIFFFKTKNCSNDDIFITSSCDDRIGKMLHNICLSAVAMSLRWANRGPWASCYIFYWVHVHSFYCNVWILVTTLQHMKRLNKTESPIFVILYILYFQRQPFRISFYLNSLVMDHFTRRSYY